MLLLTKCRYSPEDQAVLEAAYKRDPKPDKAARLELVRQVALGEKEVQVSWRPVRVSRDSCHLPLAAQIWFQNRRQSSRRKSRPLLPHEIAQYQLAKSGNSSPPLTSDPAGDRDYDYAQIEASGGLEEDSENSFRHDEGSASAVHATDGSSKLVPDAAHLADANRLPSGTEATTPMVSHVTLDGVRTVLPRSDPIAPLSGPALRHSHPSQQLGYLANRRSAPSLRAGQTEPAGLPMARPVAGEAADSASALRKSSSFVRLSMSFEGNASVVTKDGSSPSPPRASQISVQSMDSSHDAQPLSAVSNTGDNLEARRDEQQRSSSGRSRDSRTWEFWCDKDARSELEEKAEKDANGSAADAIGLLRSASGRSILGAIPFKRNSLMSRPSTGSKRPRLQDGKLGLHRSSTSSGRLQGKPQSHGSRQNKAKPKLKYSESAVSVYIPGNDSDKENWSPDRDLDPTLGSKKDTVRTDQSGLTRSVLGDGQKQSNLGLQSTSFALSAKAAEGRRVGGENADPEADPELAAFMRSGRKSNSMSSEDDMDCVQGLLSLSQGAWR